MKKFKKATIFAVVLASAVLALSLMAAASAVWGS